MTHMNDDDVRDAMYEIDRLLNLFWVNGLIGSDSKNRIIDEFPPRLSNLLGR